MRAQESIRCANQARLGGTTALFLALSFTVLFFAVKVAGAAKKERIH
jgi:hypothetical protein